MSITHSFVSAKSQSDDATLASANEWNAAHTESDFPVAEMTPAASFTIAAGYSAVVVGPITLGAAVIITLASTAMLAVL